MVPPMMFTGFFLPQSQIPKFLDPIKFVSLYKYGYQALYTNEFTDNTDFTFITENPAYFTKQPQDIAVSIICLAAVYVGCYIISLGNLYLGARSY
jgi:hypothetical protein